MKEETMKEETRGRGGMTRRPLAIATALCLVGLAQGCGGPGAKQDALETPSLTIAEAMQDSDVQVDGAVYAIRFASTTPQGVFARAVIGTSIPTSPNKLVDLCGRWRAADFLLIDTVTTRGTTRLPVTQQDLMKRLPNRMISPINILEQSDRALAISLPIPFISTLQRWPTNPPSGIESTRSSLVGFEVLDEPNVLDQGTARIAGRYNGAVLLGLMLPDISGPGTLGLYGFLSWPDGGIFFITTYTRE